MVVNEKLTTVFVILRSKSIDGLIVSGYILFYQDRTRDLRRPAVMLDSSSIISFNLSHLRQEDGDLK